MQGVVECQPTLPCSSPAVVAPDMTPVTGRQFWVPSGGYPEANIKLQNRQETGVIITWLVPLVTLLEVTHSVTELAYPETPYTVDVCYKSEERLRTDRVVEGMLC